MAEPKLRQRTQVQDVSAEGELEQPDESAGEDKKHKSLRKGCMHLCNRFLSSTPWKMGVLGFMSIVPVYGIGWALPKCLARLHDSFWCILLHYMFSCWVATQFLYNFYMTQWTDPGGSHLVKPANETTGQFELTLGSDPGADDEQQDGSAIRSVLYAPNWCKSCQRWKPPRSHHCSACQRCVLRMDHHCPITGNCIGMRNHGHFILFFMFAFLGLLYSLTLCLLSLYSMDWTIRTFNPQSKPSSWKKLFRRRLILLKHVLDRNGYEIPVQTIDTIAGLCIASSVGVAALYFVFRNETLLERNFPFKEYVEIKPEIYCPLGPGFYRRNWKLNFKDILGARWYLRLLLPTRGGPVDLRPAISPLPSAEGVAGILGRIEQVEREGVHSVPSGGLRGKFNRGPNAMEV